MASFTQYELKNGKKLWRVSWRSECGRQHTKRGFLRKSEAQAWWAEQARAGRPGARMTCAQGWERAAAAATWRPSSRRAMESAWRSQVEPRWGRVPIADVRGSEVASWLLELRQTLSAPRVSTCRAVLGHVMTWAVRDGVIAVSPLTGVRTPRLAGDGDEEVRVPSPEAVAELVELVLGDGGAVRTARWRMLRFLASTGVRWGEAAGLRMSDVTGGRATVTRTVVWPPRGGIEYQPPKGGPRREIALPADARAVVKEREAEGAEGGDLVVPGAGGTPMRSPGRGGWWREAMGEMTVDVPARLTPHDLRHFFATAALRAGMPVAVVARQLGHADPATTWRFYAGLTGDDLRGVEDLDLY